MPTTSNGLHKGFGTKPISYRVTQEKIQHSTVTVRCCHLTLGVFDNPFKADLYHFTLAVMNFKSDITPPFPRRIFDAVLHQRQPETSVTCPPVSTTGLKRRRSRDRLSTVEPRSEWHRRSRPVSRSNPADELASAISSLLTRQFFRAETRQCAAPPWRAGKKGRARRIAAEHDRLKGVLDCESCEKQNI